MTLSATNAVYPVPNDWRLCTADEIKFPEPNSCVAGPFGSKISSKYFVDDGVPVIRGSNLTGTLSIAVYWHAAEARRRFGAPGTFAIGQSKGWSSPIILPLRRDRQSTA
jgi:hypothetical protein